jgi:signal transduction histidine kinase
VTDIPTREFAAAVSSSEEAAAASSRASRQLLDSVVARTIAILAHDVRNSLGVVSMQVEAIAVRAASKTADMPAIQAHANVASDHIERLAEMTNALIAFARGRMSSDLAVIVKEAAALLPMREVTVECPGLASVSIDPLLTRAVTLELLVLALGNPAVPSFVVSCDEAGSSLEVNAGVRLYASDALEWVVQFRKAGGRITPTEDGLRLQFPPIA